jgi:uncharacterized protein (DUF4213/DUF364 family)
MTMIEEAKEKLRDIIQSYRLMDEPVTVSIGTLTSRQAIGNPTRQDYPLLEGREVMIEAQFKDSYGQAFTDHPNEFKGSLRDVLSKSLDTNDKRAIFMATLNAVMANLGMVSGVRHCHDEDPEECAAQIADHILTNFGKVKVGLIGLQPAILENLVKTFSAENVNCTDLNQNNIDIGKFGIEIWNGRTETKRLIGSSDIVLVTSSTLVNDTFESINDMFDTEGKRLIIFGVTGAGMSELFGLDRLCFKAN